MKALWLIAGSMLVSAEASAQTFNQGIVTQFCQALGPDNLSIRRNCAADQRRAFDRMLAMSSHQRFIAATVIKHGVQECIRSWEPDYSLAAVCADRWVPVGIRINSQHETAARINEVVSLCIEHTKPSQPVLVEKCVNEVVSGM